MEKTKVDGRHVLCCHHGVRLVSSPSGVLSLILNCGENLINPPMVDALGAALDIVDQTSHPKALIVTSTDDKFFMNGLDVAWMSSHPDGVLSLMQKFWKVLARLLTLNCHTVGVLQA